MEARLIIILSFRRQKTKYEIRSYMYGTLILLDLGGLASNSFQAYTFHGLALKLVTMKFESAEESA
jgi:hypothetical protein